MRVKPFLILILLAAASGARAQHAAPAKDTVIKGSTIEVLQSYKPEVKPAPKPEWIPQLPPSDTTHPSFSYDVPQQTLYYTYNSLPLRPLALGKDITPLPFPNYVKLGGGNLSTLFLDAGIGSIKGDDYETAIHLHHISQSGDIKYEQSALSGIEADGLLHKDNNDWHASVAGERNQYAYYGGNEQVNINSDSVKQVYTTVRAVVGVESKQDSDNKLSYDPSINASLYTARFNASEVTLGIKAPFTYKIDPTIDFQASLLGAVTNYNNGMANVSNNYLEVLPGIQLHNGALSGHALLGLASGKATQYVLPDIQGAYTIPDSKFTVSAGWQATLLQNTYEQLSTENPFIYNNYHVMQNRTDEVFANLQGSVGDNLAFSGRLSWWQYSDLPTYLDTTGDQKQFYVVYDGNVNAVSLRIAARYQVANTWSLGISYDGYHFYGGTEQQAWGEPGTKVKGDLMINPLPKLTVTAYLALLGGICARDINNNVVKLNTGADLGGNAEYQVIPRLSAFVQLNNILNDKYQRWYGYQAYGLNIYGGVRLKF